jgi:transcription initiation factor TFIID TATA-box-binding protein
MTFSTPIIEIVNVVESAILNQKLDLDDIAVKFHDVESHPEQFPGAVFRLRNP